MASPIRSFTAHEFAVIFHRCAQSADVPECVKMFGQVFLLADYSDQVILWPAAIQLAIKYDLGKFLEAAGTVTALPEPRRRAKQVVTPVTPATGESTESAVQA